MIHTFSPSTEEAEADRSLKVDTSLLYTASSRTRITKKDSASKKKKNLNNNNNNKNVVGVLKTLAVSSAGSSLFLSSYIVQNAFSPKCALGNLEWTTLYFISHPPVFFRRSPGE